jgi:hypothetical protein
VVIDGLDAIARVRNRATMLDGVQVCVARLLPMTIPETWEPFICRTAANLGAIACESLGRLHCKEQRTVRRAPHFSRYRRACRPDSFGVALLPALFSVIAAILARRHGTILCAEAHAGQRPALRACRADQLSVACVVLAAPCARQLQSRLHRRSHTGDGLPHK